MVTKQLTLAEIKQMCEEFGGCGEGTNIGWLIAEVERLRAERADVEHDLAAALLLNPFNDTRQILDLLTHALAIVQEPGAVHLRKKAWQT
jgi:capsule polysaccharide export protein KpsE/RkpR